MIPIKFTADPLPSDFTGTLQDFQDRFLLNLRGSISDNQVLTGQIGGAKPESNIGPWLNNDTWYVWNGAEYVPSTVKVGSMGYTVQLGGATTVGDAKNFLIPNYTQTLQDKDGVIALLSDVYQGRPTVTLSGTTPTIDWNLSNNFVQTLSGDTSPKMSNSLDGQKIYVALRNSGTSYTVTWPAVPAIFWSTGTPPTQSASATDLYIFKNIAGSIFGRVVQAYS